MAFSARASAVGGEHTPIMLPRAWMRGTSDFSFSGLKTAVWHLLEGVQRDAQGCLDEQTSGAIAVAFQDSVVDVLATKVAAASREHRVSTICVCGGVASNLLLRSRITEASRVPVHVPPPNLCVDNGAMISAAAYYRQAHRPWQDGDPMAVDVDSGLALPSG